jgi:cyclopropane-fatty-acyl-phospholipid synthase
MIPSRALDALPKNVAIVLPGDRRLGADAATAVATVFMRTETAAAMLREAPSLLAFAEGFADGEIDVEGDLVAALEAAYALDALGGTGTPVPATRPAMQDAVQFHYDLSDDFFALFLDRRMVYSCAYYRTPGTGLDDAQEAKLDLLCRKLRLAAGERLLDVGCGWGGLVGWASARHHADVLGVTLSEAQARYATRTLRAAGLGAQARVEHRDYRTLEGAARFDKVVAVGVLEHLGVGSWDEYFGCVHRLLRPGGLFLNHGITHPAPGRYSTGMTFLWRHVFPGADFERIGHVVSRMEAAGFRILDVEALGGHYARTTRHWLERLQARANEARALVGERMYRTWIGYLAAATVAFAAGWIDVHQVLAKRPDPSAPVEPETRDAIYRA